MSVPPLYKPDLAAYDAKAAIASNLQGNTTWKGCTSSTRLSLTMAAPSGTNRNIGVPDTRYGATLVSLHSRVIAGATHTSMRYSVLGCIPYPCRVFSSISID